MIGGNDRKTVLVLGGVFGLLGLALIPTVVHPRMNPQYYSECNLLTITRYCW